MEKSPPYIKFGVFRSNDKSNPDSVELRVKNIETFDSDLSTNVIVERKTLDSWEDAVLSLKSHDSENATLLHLWQKCIRDKTLKKGKKFILRTWLGLSKNKRPIRRFELIF